MGSRGSGSHRTMAASMGGAPPGRTGRDQLAEWRDNATALRQIIRDTGYSLAEAQLAQDTQIRYYGADYDSFTEGLLPHETEIISQALMRMPYYNGGSIYRGISVEDSVADSVFLRKWQPGTVQYFSDKLGNGNGVVQSFSSNEDVAERFGQWDWVSQGKTSIKFVMDDNKTAPGVQHISKFGTAEAEVLLPSYQTFVIDSVVQISDSRWGGRRFIIHLKDRGRKIK